MTAQTVGALGEHAVIERLRTLLPPEPPSVVVGIGDDAAVLEPERGTLSVVTTDAMVEGVHFDRAFCPVDAIGHKALAVNLSDLAAMGASPAQVLLSLILPSTLAIDDLDSLLRGLVSLAARHEVSVVGGNVTASPGPLVVDVTAIGSVRRRRILTRGGARAGDLLYLSGEIGAAAAGLGQLRDATRADSARADDGVCPERYLRPEPRVRLGAQLGRNRAARACIDLSDGLADAVRQLTSASGVGAVVEAEALPICPEARRWFEREGIDPVHASLSAGDDYELLFAAPPRDRRRVEAARRHAGKPPVTRIGRLTPDPGLVLVSHGQEQALPVGFEHFR